MDQMLTQRIRHRAYEIWVAHGYKDGDADKHWLAAEREVLNGTPVPAKAETKTTTRATRPAARAKKQAPAELRAR
jgi:hypothetical protein